MNKTRETKVLFAFLLLVMPLRIAAQETDHGKIVKILDGDTVYCYTSNQCILKVELHGIDCPEIEQDYGDVSRNATKELCWQKTVSIRVVSRSSPVDVDGIVVLENGVNLNHRLIELGHAWWNRNVSSINDSLEDLEKRARDDRVGLWSGINLIPPWEFREYDAITSAANQEEDERGEVRPNLSSRKEMIHPTEDTLNRLNAFPESETTIPFHTSTSPPLFLPPTRPTFPTYSAPPMMPTFPTYSAPPMMPTFPTYSAPPMMPTFLIRPDFISIFGGYMVAVTHAGACYHAPFCSTINDYVMVPVSQAIAMGLQPCRRCHP